MFEKIHNVITEGAFSHKPVDGKLEPIHCLDICNLVGNNVVVGGVRRTAEIAIISPDDKECVNAKRNLTPDKFHRFMSNNSVYLEEKPTKEQLTKIFQSIRECGEPGFINVQEAKRRREDFAGMNPCTSGDTLIPVRNDDGTWDKVRIDSVVGEEVETWNGFEWTKVVPRITGYNQPMLEVEFSNGKKLKCTDYHKFLIDGCDKRIKAIDLNIGDVLERFSEPNGYSECGISVTSVKRIKDADTVYCFTDPKRGTGMFNGIMTGQCAEIILPPNAVCNLTTINLTAFVDKDGEIDFKGLKQAVKLSARAAYRMTCLDLELPEWNEVHHRDRLLGCSVTGYQDFWHMAKPSKKKQSILEAMRGWTRACADLYASELGTPYSLKVTAVKPEGTLSLVANAVSPGIHHQHATYFIRRIRVNASDPLAKTAVALGWRIHPEVGQTMDNATTLVIDFPCHSPSTISKNDVSAVKQLDIYRMFQKYYTEQNTSNTITVKPNEWEDVTNYVYDNWEDILAVTFLATDGKNYPLMPYEECTKEEYEELKSKMKKFDPEILNNMEITTRNFGQEYEILDDRTECASGVCPIR